MELELYYSHGYVYIEPNHDAILLIITRIKKKKMGNLKIDL